MAQSIISDTEELPIAAHIFEGHLYIKDEKSNKWLWRLFRFDGTSLTCLSSKKNKLPPHTLLDKPYYHSHSVSSRPVSALTHSASTHSFTSPILATPKHRADRIIASSTESASYGDNNSSNNVSQPISASYYQLPKWTIEMINIASISLLKPKHKKSKPFKMPTSTKPKSFTIRTYDGACFVLRANKQHDLERWIFVLAKMWKFAQVARQMLYNNGPRDSIVLPPLNQNNAITLAAIGSGSTSNLAYNANDQMTTSPIQVSQEQQQQQHYYSHQLPVNALKTSHVGQSQKHHHDTMLSDEKALWIENWVKSLAELEAHSPSESYNDVFDIVTNAPTHDINPPKRTLSRHHYQPSHTNDDVHSLQKPPSIRGHHSSSSLHNTTESKPNRARLTRYNSDYLGYFQDAKTVYTNETSGSIQQEPKPSLKYHHSVRAKPIRSHTTGHDIPMPFSAAISSTHESLQHGCSPLALLEYKYSQDKQQLPSPPTTPAVFHAAGLESDEDVCLADVRRSLQSMEISKMQAQQDLIAKRRSESMMVNASRRHSNW